MSGMIVTGASRGIGAAIARVLADRKCPLLLTYHGDLASSEALANELSAKTQVDIFGLDVAVETEVEALFVKADASFERLAGLVNNAAYLGTVGRRVIDADPAVLQKTFGTNVIGLMLCCREAARRMAKSRGGAGGRIVNISSTAAVRGSAGDWVDYAASKAAVDCITRGFAGEMSAEAVRVNAVAPGLTDTESHARAGAPERVSDFAARIPLGRAATAAEIAETVAWMLCEAPDYMTGVTLPVAGGF